MSFEFFSLLLLTLLASSTLFHDLVDSATLCNDTYSCASSLIKETSGVICSGELSCTNSSISVNINSGINCWGSLSCYNCKLLNNSGDARTQCLGTMSCSNTIIYSSSDSVGILCHGERSSNE